MSQVGLQRAQTLIKMGNYDEAYVILKKLDHPTARKWLQQIDAMYQERRQQEASIAQEPDELSNSVFSSVSTSASAAKTPANTIKPAPSRNASPLIPAMENVKVKTGKYSALRFVAGAYFFLGILVAGIGTALGILTYREGYLYESAGISTIVTSLLLGLGLLAVGQLVQVILEIVENSRTQVRILQRIADSLENNQQ